MDNYDTSVLADGDDIMITSDVRSSHLAGDTARHARIAEKPRAFEESASHTSGLKALDLAAAPEHLAQASRDRVQLHVAHALGMPSDIRTKIQGAYGEAELRAAEGHFAQFNPGGALIEAQYLAPFTAASPLLRGMLRERFVAIPADTADFTMGRGARTELTAQLAKIAADTGDLHEWNRLVSAVGDNRNTMYDLLKPAVEGEAEVPLERGRAAVETNSSQFFALSQECKTPAQWASLAKIFTEKRGTRPGELRDLDPVYYTQNKAVMDLACAPVTSTSRATLAKAINLGTAMDLDNRTILYRIAQSKLDNFSPAQRASLEQHLDVLYTGS